MAELLRETDPADFGADKPRFSGQNQLFPKALCCTRQGVVFSGVDMCECSTQCTCRFKRRS